MFFILCTYTISCCDALVERIMLRQDTNTMSTCTVFFLALCSVAVVVSASDGVRPVVCGETPLPTVAYAGDTLFLRYISGVEVFGPGDDIHFVTGGWGGTVSVTVGADVTSWGIDDEGKNCTGRISVYVISDNAYRKYNEGSDLFHDPKGSDMQCDACLVDRYENPRDYKYYNVLIVGDKVDSSCCVSVKYTIDAHIAEPIPARFLDLIMLVLCLIVFAIATDNRPYRSRY